MRARIPTALALMIALAVPGLAQAERAFSARISISDALHANKDPDDTSEFTPDVLVLRVGTPVHASIHYEIGLMEWPAEGGAGHLLRSDVTAPEYELGCIESGCGMPPGLYFNSADGTITGTPNTAGSWHFRPAVRDRVNGEKPYRGNGFWGTYTGLINGKTYFKSKSILQIVVLNASPDSDIKLTCSPSTPNADILLLTLDLTDGYLFELDATARPGAIAKINPNADVLGWHGVLHSYQFMLDRGTGTLTGSFPEMNRRDSWHCEKRAASRVF